MTFSEQQLLSWIAGFAWPLARISAMLMVMTGLGSASVPSRIRLFLAVAIALTVWPVLPPPPDIALFSVAGFLVTAQQVLIGVAMGLVSQLVMQTFILAGQMISMQSGLGMASIVDPANGQQVPVIGQFYMILGTLLFFLLDGHLMLIQLVVASFEAVPVGLAGLTAADFQALAAWFGWLFSAALSMSLSALTALLVINFAFGIITRAAPQLNIFAIGFPITMLSGLLVLWLLLSNFTSHFDGQWQRGLALICTVLEGTCDGGIGG